MVADAAQDVVAGVFALPNTEALLVGVPLTTGLVEVVKRAGMPDRYASIAALAVAIGVIALLVEDPVAIAVTTVPRATGLAASGLYDNYRTLISRAPVGDAAGE